MAKQAGLIKITGTIDDVTFYEMNGEYYARKKSSLTREKVKHHISFALTRVYNRIMGRASSLASCVYREIPGAKRKHAEFRLLTARAHALLKAGFSEAEVLKRLRKGHRDTSIVIKDRTKLRLKESEHSNYTDRYKTYELTEHTKCSDKAVVYPLKSGMGITICQLPLIKNNIMRGFENKDWDLFNVAAFGHPR